MRCGSVDVAAARVRSGSPSDGILSTTTVRSSSACDLGRATTMVRSASSGVAAEPDRAPSSPPGANDPAALVVSPSFGFGATILASSRRYPAGAGVWCAEWASELSLTCESDRFMQSARSMTRSPGALASTRAVRQRFTYLFSPPMAVNTKANQALSAFASRLDCCTFAQPKRRADLASIQPQITRSRAAGRRRKPTEYARPSPGRPLVDPGDARHRRSDDGPPARPAAGSPATATRCGFPL